MEILIFMKFFERLKKTLNKRYMGILFGITLPFIALFLLWKIQMNDRSLSEFIALIIKNTDLQTSLLTYSILPNMFIFYFVNFRWRWDNFTTGLVGSTIFLVLIIAALILL